MTTTRRGARPEDRAYFFDDGLRFGCTQCGDCCTGAHGTIAVNAREAERISAHLGLSVDAFLGEYAYPVDGGHSLKEQANGDCVFFCNRTCSIYAVRPTQCRTYPFWAENVRSEPAWKRTCRECPGIGAGRLYGREEILRIAAESLDARAVADGTGPQPRRDTSC